MHSAKKIKMLISVALALSILFSTSANAIAASYNFSDDEATTFELSFIDASQIENSIIATVLSPGNVIVDYYIDGIFTGTVTASTSDGYIVNGTYTSATTKSIEHFTYDFTPTNVSLPNTSFEPITPLSYIYDGTINYKPYYDNFGDSYTESLKIYMQQGTINKAYRTVNAAKGDAASIIIGSIIAVVTAVCPVLAAIAGDIFGAILIATGSSIVAGKVQSAITHTYYMLITPYDIRATDPKTSRSNYYTGERCQAAVPGVGSDIEWSSDYYYTGYLPWNSASNASMMFSDFWDFAFPGIA